MPDRLYDSNSWSVSSNASHCDRYGCNPCCSLHRLGRHEKSKNDTSDSSEGDHMRSETLTNDYWDVVGALWDVIEIYEGPETFQQTYNSVPKEWGLVFAAHSCQQEVCFGGFEQFFWNPAGVLAREAVEGFRELGLPQLAALVQEAMDLLGSPYPSDRNERKSRLSLVPKGHLDVLDETFYALVALEQGGFRAAANRYVEQMRIMNRDSSKLDCA